MAAYTWSQGRKTLGSIDYMEKGEFPQGKLPTCRDIVESMLYLLRPKRSGQAQRSRGDASQLLAELLQEHWLFCNLYTINTRHIKNKILKLYEEFVSLVQTRKQQQNENYFSKTEAFNKQGEEIFYVFCKNTEVRKLLFLF